MRLCGIAEEERELARPHDLINQAGRSRNEKKQGHRQACDHWPILKVLMPTGKDNLSIQSLVLSGLR
jgi:hypothetical protein